MPYKQNTKSVQSLGPENIEPERPLLGFSAQVLVNSLCRITFEYKGKIWPKQDRENSF